MGQVESQRAAVEQGDEEGRNNYKSVIRTVRAACQDCVKSLAGESGNGHDMNEWVALRLQEDWETTASRVASQRE